jgi:hypothetical protein
MTLAIRKRTRYLDPPRNAIALCVGEKTQVHALDRTAPIPPMRPGLPQMPAHDLSGTAP